MPDWTLLAEARIREWLQLPAGASPVPEPGLPLEVQLMVDIGVLDRMAAAADKKDDAAALTRKADDLEMRLMILLESQGRPLAAQHFAAQRRVQRS